jgi:hypothetical protein
MVQLEGEAAALNRYEPIDFKTSGPQRVGSNQSSLQFSPLASDQRI